MDEVEYRKPLDHTSIRAQHNIRDPIMCGAYKEKVVNYIHHRQGYLYKNSIAMPVSTLVLLAAEISTMHFLSPLPFILYLLVSFGAATPVKRAVSQGT